jgi:uncharacterized protein YhaN
MIFNADSTILPLQRKWPFNLIAYLLRLSNIFSAGSVAGLVGVVTLRNFHQSAGNIWVLPLAFSLAAISLVAIARRLVVSEARRLLQIIRNANTTILKTEKAIDFRLELASDREEREALCQFRKEIAQIKQRRDEIREELEDILTTSSRFSRNVEKLMAMVTLVRQLASTPMPTLSTS